MRRHLNSQDTPWVRPWWRLWGGIWTVRTHLESDLGGVYEAAFEQSGLTLSQTLVAFMRRHLNSQDSPWVRPWWRLWGGIWTVRTHLESDLGGVYEAAFEQSGLTLSQTLVAFMRRHLNSQGSPSVRPWWRLWGGIWTVRTHLESDLGGVYEAAFEQSGLTLSQTLVAFMRRHLNSQDTPWVRPWWRLWGGIWTVRTHLESDLGGVYEAAFEQSGLTFSQTLVAFMRRHLNSQDSPWVRPWWRLWGGIWTVRTHLESDLGGVYEAAFEQSGLTLSQTLVAFMRRHLNSQDSPWVRPWWRLWGGIWTVRTHLESDLGGVYEAAFEQSGHTLSKTLVAFMRRHLNSQDSPWVRPWWRLWGGIWTVRTHLESDLGGVYEAAFEQSGLTLSQTLVAFMRRHLNSQGSPSVRPWWRLWGGIWTVRTHLE